MSQLQITEFSNQWCLVTRIKNDVLLQMFFVKATICNVDCAYTQICVKILLSFTNMYKLLCVYKDSKATNGSLQSMTAGKEPEWELHLIGAYRMDLCERKWKKKMHIVIKRTRLCCKRNKMIQARLCHKSWEISLSVSFVMHSYSQ